MIERPIRCLGCSRPVARLAVDGLCPACLFRCALESDPIDTAYSVLALAPAANGTKVRLFGRFELFEVIGRGGMGVVYRARERATGRWVALKIATPHLIAQDEFRSRFQLEIRAVASVEHPHVLPIYEVGEHDGLPFFTMKLAEGGSLAAHLGDFNGRYGEIAKLAARVAAAVAYAHAQGILHRDLKPANILLGKDSHPYVSDFGLVKWMSGDTALTTSSVAMGAPGYAAPEQVRPRSGQPLGPTADVFSLGVVLYELMTGRKPFTATTLWEAVERMEDGAYLSPRSLVPGCPRDLETICCKCLEGEPGRRYASADALAADLTCYIEGRVIHARSTTPWTRVWKWTRRNAWVAGLGTGVAVLLLAGTLGATMAAFNLARARDRATWAEGEAREKLWQSLVSEARALRASTDIGRRHRALDALRRAAEIRFAPELRDEAIQALTLTDLKMTAEWKSEVPFGAFTPDLQYYALELNDGSCEVRRTADHTTVARLPAPATEVFACWRFTPDASTLSIIGKGGEAWLWRWRDNHIVPIPYPLGTAPVCLEFSPDGSSIAAPAAGGGVALFDRSGRQEKKLAPAITRPWAFAFTADGSAMAISDRDSGRVIIVDVATGANRYTLSHAAAVSCVGFSPDGKWMAAGVADSAVTLWHLPDRTAHVLHGHSRFCETVVFSPDSSILASSGYDQTARFWDVRSRQPLLVLPAANASVFFSATGNTLAIATEDARWMVFELLANRVRINFEPASHRDDDYSVSFDLDPSGRWIAVGGERGVRLYDVITQREAAYLTNPDSGRNDVAFDPKSGDLLATTSDGVLKRWTVTRRGEEDSAVYSAPRDLRHGSFRLAGRSNRESLLALAHSDSGRVDVVSMVNGHGPERSLTHPMARKVVFDPTGQWMLVGGWKSPHVAVWSLQEWKADHAILESDNAAFDIGDGGRTVLIGTPRAFRIIRVADWTETHRLARPGSPLITSYVDAAAAVPLGACQWTHASLRLLDLRSGAWLATLPVTITTGLDQFQLSGDGSTLAIAGEHHRVQHWDLQRLNLELTELGLGWSVNSTVEK